MKQVTSKTPEKDIKNVLGSDFDVSIDSLDGNMVSLRITNFETGDFFTITKSGEYTNNIRCIVKAPPKMEKVYRLCGKVGGVQYVKDFKDNYEATKLKNHLDESGEVDLDIVEVEVEVNDE